MAGSSAVRLELQRRGGGKLCNTVRQSAVVQSSETLPKKRQRRFTVTLGPALGAPISTSKSLDGVFDREKISQTTKSMTRGMANLRGMCAPKHYLIELTCEIKMSWPATGCKQTPCLSLTSSNYQ